MKKRIQILFLLTCFQYSFNQPNNYESEFEDLTALVEQANLEPIVAEKPSFIQLQLAKVGLPVYFAMRAGKNYIVSLFSSKANV